MSEIKVNSIKGVSASTAAISIDNSSGTCTANITNNLSNRNLIINGAMQVAQRATSTTSIGTTLKYGVDRFFIHNVQGTAVQTATQENDGPEGFYKSLKVTCTTADTDYSTNNQSKIEYRIEGTDIQRINFGTANAKTLAVSFYIKSNKTGNSAIALVNNANARSFVHQFTIASANTWQRVSFTVAGDTTGNWPVESDNIGMRIRWGTFGTDFQTSTFDAWQAGQIMTTSNSPINFNSAINDYLQITGVQIEVGSVATDFEHRPFGQELALCQRYFFRIQGDNGDRVGIGGYNTGPNEARFNVVFPQTMRSNPTYSGAGTAQFDAADDSADFNLSDMIIDSTPTGFISSIGLQIATSGMTNGQSGGIRFRSDSSSLSFNAEL